MSLSDPSTGSISFPSNFESLKIETNGATIHTRVGGQGPAVILLHGFGTTGDMWVPLASVPEISPKRMTSSRVWKRSSRSTSLK
jgi:hypothetical protein